MSRFTNNVQEPYPTPGQPGAGALDLELLARRTDVLLTDLDTRWPAQMLRASAGWSGPVAGNTPITATNVEWPISLSTLDYSQGGVFTPTVTPFFEFGVPVAGWWHIKAQCSTTPTGVANANSQRRLIVRVLDRSVTANSISVPGDVAYAEDAEPGAGPTGLVIDYVVQMKLTDRLQFYYLHGNTSSSLTINSDGTSFAMTLIQPER